MKNILVVFFSFLCVWADAQTKDDSIVYQTNCLTKLYPNYIVDGIRLHHTDTNRIKLLEDYLQIKKYKFVRNMFSNWVYGSFAKDGIFITYSDFVYVVDTNILDSKRKKDKFWETFPSSKITSIEKLEREESVKLYGERGKNGIIRIKTKN